MQQYHRIKAKYPDALLLFRVGDFYEAMGEDAVKVSQILDILLTKRSHTSVELAGFPHHALDIHVPKLVRAGYRVAICDQLEAAGNTKGLVKRGVTELITPGLSYHDQVLDKKHNNYLASIHVTKDVLGIALLDISTGEFLVAQGSQAYIDKLVQSFAPSEVLFSKAHKSELLALLKDTCNFYTMEDWAYHLDYAEEKLNKHFSTATLKGFGIENMPEGIVAAGAILRYLEETEHHSVKHIRSIARLPEERYVWLDKFTIRNLELIRGQQKDSVPLIDVIDHTVTPMGTRLLRKWLLLPLKELSAIQKRLSIVEAFVKDPALTKDSFNCLRQMGDLERLISKIAAKRANPREMLGLGRALQQIGPIQKHLKLCACALVSQLSERLHPCDYLLGQIDKTVKPNPPVAINRGNFIKTGVHEELDELRQIAHSSKEYLQRILDKEREKTGITSLKIGYTKVFGYYLEVTHVHKDKVPSEWVRKQTLVKSERYVTEELYGYEAKILHAEERMQQLEYQIYQDLLESAIDYVPQVQQNAQILAQLDCYLSFARQAVTKHYVKPIINDSYVIDIRAGRHPTIEENLPPGQSYIPNDAYLDNQAQQIAIVSGPNMAGKSAYLRQVAINVLMAHIGSFVPAEKASIGLVDKIFTRVGASDNLARGESTFMVEMTETASIINNLSQRSLVLMDEIGRGTSTYDGIAIAWAIVEYLNQYTRHKPKIIFATHYHELSRLSAELKGVKNFNVAVKKVDQKILFLRKLQKGSSAHSFGIEVAEMAGLPGEIIQRAYQIMEHLAKERQEHQQAIGTLPKKVYQLTLFQADPAFAKVKSMLTTLDINALSPVEAMIKLSQLKAALDEKSDE